MTIRMLSLRRQKMTEVEREELVRKILGRYKMKYKDISSIFVNNKYDINRLHINLSSMISSLSVSSDESIIDGMEITISASIINMIAHYRHYLASIRSKKSGPPIIYVYADSDNDSYDITKAYEYVSIILKHIPYTHFISIPKEDISATIMFFDRLDNDKNEYNSVIISKDDRDIQSIIDTNNIMIRINKDNNIVYWGKTNPIAIYLDDESFIYDRYLPIIQSFVGIKDHPGVAKYGKAKTKKLFMNNISKLAYEYNYIDPFIDDIGDILNTNQIAELRRAFKYISVKSKYIGLKSTDKLTRMYMRDKKYAYHEIAELNQKYYTGLDSLMIEELTEDVIIMPKTKIVW